MALVEVHRLENILAATVDESVVPPGPSAWEQMLGPMMLLAMLGMAAAMAGGTES